MERNMPKNRGDEKSTKIENMGIIEPSELIINGDGSVFHLHIRPEQLADRIVLVGDPGRVKLVAGMFDSVEAEGASREFVWATGVLGGKRLTALSTGIGTDNIDIVMTELDALANVDFTTRTVREKKKKLYIVRLGTSGALQTDIPLGSNILAKTSVGFDGLLNFYAGRDRVCDQRIERAFTLYMQWNPLLAKPYFVDSSRFLNDLFGDFTTEGITISAPGFYGPQGRVVRLPLADPDINAKIEAFRYEGRRITNYEMESSALAGLAALLGHEATTICTIIAQRAIKQSNADYQSYIEKMVELALQKLVSF